MAKRYRFVGGPERTRTATFDLSVSASGNAVCVGRATGLGMGFEFTVSGSTLTVNGTSYTMTGSAPFTGTVSLSVTTKEVTNFVENGPMSAQIYEMSKPGTAYANTLTLGGVTVDLSGTVGAGSAALGGTLGVSPVIACYARVSFPFGFSGSDAGSITITPTSIPFSAEEGAVSTSGSGTGSADDVSFLGDDYTWSWSTSESAGYGAHAEGSWTITRMGAPYIVLPPGFAWNSGSTFRYEAYGESETRADRTGTYNLAVYAGSGLSSEAMEAQLLPKNDRVSFTGSTSSAFALHWRRRWAGGAIITTVTGGSTNAVTNHRTEHGAVEAKWKRAGQPDAFLVRFGLRLWSYDALDVSHDDDTLVDDGASLTPTGGLFEGVWSAASGGSVAIDSGAVNLTGSAGKTLKRTFVDTATTVMGRMQGYPCLRLRLRCSAAAHAITVSILDHAGHIPKESGIGSEPKKWGVTTGAANTWEYLYLDLSAEHNGQPFSTDWSRSVGEAGGCHFLGVNAREIVFSGLGSGTYEIDELRLIERVVADGSTPTPALHCYTIAQSGLTLGAIGMSAGQSTVEITADPDLGLKAPITRLSPTSGEIASGLGKFRLPGWGLSDASPRAGSTFTSSEPLPPFGTAIVTVYTTYSDRFCSDMPLGWLAGQGYQWTGSWNLLFDSGAIGLSGSGPMTASIPAQWSLQQFTWEWDEALASIPDPLGCVASLPAGGWWGRMLSTAQGSTTSSYRGAIGGNAKAQEAYGGTGSATSAVSSPTGFYAVPSFGAEGLSAPVGGLTLYTVSADGSTQSPKPSYLMTLASGRRRLVLIESAPTSSGTCLSLTQSQSGRLCRAWSEGGTLWLEHQSQAGGIWERLDTGISGSCPDVVYNLHTGALLVAYVDSGIKLRTTTNEGSSFSVATTISSTGTHPTVCLTQSGGQLYFWYDSGAIKRRAYDGQLQQTIAAGSVVASGVADDAMRAVELQDGRIRLVYRNTSGALVAATSSDGGNSFS